jgi:sugar phosphate isomerase/epimerase
MRHALAVWNFAWDAADVPNLLERMPAWGFDAAAFNPQALLPAPESDLNAIADKVRALDLAVTVHGNCAMTREEITSTAALFGDHLRCYSFDAAMTSDSRGYLYDAARIAQVLTCTAAITEGPGAYFGIEDFPLDRAAVDFFAPALDPFLDHPRYGILIDLGHMHLRRSAGGAFGALSPEDYLRRTPVPIFELHIHDNDGKRDEHRHIGEGTQPWDAVAAGVVAASGSLADGVVATIEVAPALHDGDPDAELPRIPDTLEVWQKLIAL